MIADGKRGDVAVTARAYAQALVGEHADAVGDVPGLGADAFTANPLLGLDALAPLARRRARRRAGVFVLVRTSNPGAADVEDLGSPPAARSGSASRGSSAELGDAGAGAASRTSAPSSARPRREHLARTARADAAHAVPAAGRRRPGRRRGRDLAPAFAPAAPAASSPPRARSSAPTRPRRRDPATPRARRPSACAQVAWSLG